MNRREFLAFRVTRSGTTLELSCEALYMQFVDARSGGGEIPMPMAEADAAADVSQDASQDVWQGELTTMLARPSADELLARLERDLAAAQRLRILQAEWLGSTELGARLAPIFTAFRARGGELLVETSGSSQR